jgi:arylsulfatase A-like enzyme
MKNAWILMLGVVAVAGVVVAKEGARPNIVFILADDLGREDVGFMGAKEIRTPELDKLANGGARLEQFYVQPVCSPTRAALMTGRYPMRHGLQVGVIRPWAKYGLPLEERMLPQVLREAGYTTAMVGKWHLGSFDKAYWPTERGFDTHYGHLFGAIDYFTHIRDGQPDWYRDGRELKEEGYSTYLMAREAVEVIRKQPKDKPLFLYVAFNAVHAPHQVPEKYLEPYGKLQGLRRTYAGMVAALDEAVGRIAGAIDETGRRGNTLYIFSSDNGGPNPGRVTNNGALRAGKGTLYEGGVRVCAFAAWEGHIKAGTVVNEPLHMVDWYPTLLKLAGASAEQKTALDGRDAWGTITEGKASPHEQILLNTDPTRGAIRVGDWKLVLNGGAPSAGDEGNGAGAPAQTTRRVRGGATQVELFNLREDAGEKVNLAKGNPDRVKELRSRYDALAAEALKPKNVE